MRISTETISRRIYAAAQVGDASCRHVRRAHKRRRRQTRYGQGRRIFPGRIDIDARPQVVADRSRFGDWEADLVCASKGRAALVSCNERTSRFLVLAKVESKTAAAFNEALVPRRHQKHNATGGFAMKYPIAVHKDPDSCYGVTVPDIPGCFSAGESIEEAISNAHEAITGHLEILAEDGVLAPSPSAIDSFLALPAYAGAVWAFVDVDITPFLGGTEKATVTLPRLLIRKIDAAVLEGRAKSRSAFLADSAAKALGL